VTCTDSSQRDIPIREKSAGAVIFRLEAGQVLYLLLHYEEGHWGSAKGHMEKAETLEETARREVREETGLTDIRFQDGFKEEISYSFQGDKGTVRKTVVLLLAETPVRNIRLSDEHVDYGWFSYENALERTTYSDEKGVLIKANCFLLSLRSASP
jgi:bis(5'-nucleosidyl)-tetraphosphatase